MKGLFAGRKGGIDAVSKRMEVIRLDLITKMAGKLEYEGKIELAHHMYQRIMKLQNIEESTSMSPNATYKSVGTVVDDLIWSLGEQDDIPDVNISREMVIVTGYEKKSGWCSNSTLNALSTLVNVLKSQRKFGLLKMLYEGAVVRCESKYGPDSEDAVKATQFLLEILIEQESFEEAKELLNTLINRCEQKYGEYGDETIHSMEILVNVLLEEDAVEEARIVQDVVVQRLLESVQWPPKRDRFEPTADLAERTQTLYDNTHSRAIANVSLLMTILKKMNKIDESKQIRRKVAVLCENPSSQFDRYTGVMVFADLLLEQGHQDDAEILFDYALKGYAFYLFDKQFKDKGEFWDRNQEDCFMFTLGKLADVLLIGGAPEAVPQLYDQAAKDLVKRFGVDSIASSNCIKKIGEALHSRDFVKASDQLLSKYQLNY